MGHRVEEVSGGAAAGEAGRHGIIKKTTQSPNRQYKAPTDFTKPRQTIQRHKILDKALNILDNYLNYLTRVATHIDSTCNIRYLIFKIYILIKKVLTLIVLNMAL